MKYPTNWFTFFSFDLGVIIINNIPSNFFCFLLSNEFLFATSMICIYIKIIQSLLRFQIDLSLYVRKIDRKRYVGSTTRKAILLGILISVCFIIMQMPTCIWREINTSFGLRFHSLF